MAAAGQNIKSLVQTASSVGPSASLSPSREVPEMAVLVEIALLRAVLIQHCEYSYKGVIETERLTPFAPADSEPSKESWS